MLIQSTAAPTDRHSKRARLKEIVSGLGEAATPAQIREEAYRVGFGAVHPQMLIAVRNKLWPNRPKRSHSDSRPLNDPAALAIATCPDCGSLRTRAKGFRRNGDVFERRHHCRDCGRVYRTQSNVILRGKQVCRIRARELSEKEYTKCHRVLPIASFGKRNGDRDLYTSACKECANHTRRTNYGTRSIQSQYGLTVEQYRELLDRQDGKCAICRNHDAGKRFGRSLPFCVDHCHKTGVIRGLLCHRCNLGIGNFDDDIDRLTAAVEYIRRYETGNA